MITIRNLYYAALKTPKGEKYSAYIVADTVDGASGAANAACPEDIIEEIKLERRVVCA